MADQLGAGLAGEPRLGRFRLQVLDWTRIAPPDLPAAPALPEEETAAPDQVAGPATAGNTEAGAAEAGAAADAAADLAAELGAAAGHLASDALLGLLTGVAVRHRAALTDAAGDFARNIGFYLAQGARVRELIRADLAATAPGRPVILYGHSLGGVAAVDLLRESDAAALGVDLLVTAGSQAPWLALLGLAVPGADPAAAPAPAPSAPWLNLWDRRDLLAFCAERVWPAGVRTHPVHDVELSSGQAFPQSHGSYFRSAEGFRAVADALFPDPG